ncbi:uncharacterized protein LOC106382986 [Brassica napus]|uniref:uncharacterized protein LOC106382986 n=1 Tax=Brassica napus TaxID=3708 RepID=UPI0006AB1F22|nr:uncharacterized protein LOC106382986 [Brassica napus]
MAAAMNEKEAMVDPFLVEALQNPRHRLTILRMELDIQKFFQSPEQQQYEFPPYPTSYLRLAAHRVAHHYGLFTTALDGAALDGSGNRILVTKTGESRYPYVCLSEIPVKQPEANGRRPQGFKLAIKARPNGGSGGAGGGSGVERNLLRSVEERKEEYEKARARIFNSPNSSDSEDSSTRAPPPPPVQQTKHNNSRLPARHESESVVDEERNGVGRTSRVAIIRDREKDRYDPDYDRNRYVRVTPPVQNFSPMPPIHLPFHDGVFPQMPRTQQPNISYGHPLNPAMTSTNAPAYTEWPSVTMSYAQTLHASDPNHFRHQNP